ncbi:hypothetical protein F4167_16080 [Candidatus Poribacteria bacterium]|nr:hypothetical protein [Candidatus Poribacteria bacterium]
MKTRKAPERNTLNNKLPDHPLKAYYETRFSVNPDYPPKTPKYVVLIDPIIVEILYSDTSLQKHPKPIYARMSRVYFTPNCKFATINDTVPKECYHFCL